MLLTRIKQPLNITTDLAFVYLAVVLGEGSMKFCNRLERTWN